MCAGWSTRRTPPAAHAASTTCDGLVIEPVWDTAVRAAAAERPGESSTTGLPALGQRPGRRDERAAVDHVLGVDGHRAGAVVVHARVHQVHHREVGLVAQRDEPRDAQVPLRQQRRQVEHQVAALAEHGDLTRREHRVRQLQLGAGVRDAEAVGADQHRAAGPGDGDGLGLERGHPRHPARTGPAVMPTTARAPAVDRLADRVDERRGGHADDDEVDRLAQTAPGLGQRGGTSAGRAPRSRPGSPAPPDGVEPDSRARLLRMWPHLAGSLLAPTTATDRGSKRAVRAVDTTLSGDP